MSWFKKKKQDEQQFVAVFHKNLIHSQGFTIEVYYAKDYREILLSVIEKAKKISHSHMGINSDVAYVIIDEKGKKVHEDDIRG